MLLLRHGQTDLSVQRRYSGHGDPELTELGSRQAAAAAARLAALPGIVAVLSSPLLRARQTAGAVAKATGAPLVIRDGLVETDFGLVVGEILRRERKRALVVLFTALEPGALGEGLHGGEEQYGANRCQISHKPTFALTVG